MSMEKCEQCGAEFLPSRVGQIYCQPLCCRRAQRRKKRQRQKEALAAKRGPRFCAACGVSIDDKYHTAVYCSYECRPKKNRVRDRSAESRKQKHRRGICRQCGREFDKTQEAKACCSRECNHKWHAALRGQERQRARDAERSAAHMVCKGCGGPIDPKSRQRKYCTIKCGARWHDRERTRKRLEVMRSMAGIHEAARRPQPVEAQAAAYTKPRRRYMVLTDTGRECRPEAMKPGESIAKFYVAWVAS